VGKKISITLQLDTGSAHDKAVFDALVALPDDDARRDYMVSAMLYYVRSPSYLMALKLEDSYAQVKALSELIKSPKLDALADRLTVVADSLSTDLREFLEATVLTAVGKAFSGQRFAFAPVAEVEVGHEEASDLIDSMINEFIT
jgi:hypothetical protein